MEKQIVNSVCGPIDPKSLGFTLTHEHFSLDFEKFYASPPVGVEDYIDDKITLSNVGYVRQYPYSSRFNINFQDDETHQAVLKDVTNFKHSGGDRTLLHDEDLQEFANLGTYCQFDLFGTECSYYQLNPTSYMQSDEQRLTHILELINAGVFQNNTIRDVGLSPGVGVISLSPVSVESLVGSYTHNPKAVSLNPGVDGS
ncbi:pter-prov protein [Culex quinquefasciatus]|uniref:Pter-prov protein n=1 Tax=Culex quinquefasciatus TaxID=7176 RepID=B0WMH4_CULQU|nr:pter-prov protein [Culex quinquefasciatus]|eukprot:XP_001849908.1 pter-prov protein [Culex quinquefasciatus]